MKYTAPVTSYLGVIECIDKIFIIKNVSLGLKQQLENAVFNRFELRLVRVDLHYQLVPLFLKIRSFQTHDVTSHHNTIIIIIIIEFHRDASLTKTSGPLKCNAICN